MRLFCAIDVPEGVKEHLALLQRSLGDSEGLRLVHPKNMHLTLNFLGERADAEEVMRSLRSVSFNPFSLRLGNLGFFPDESNPRVLWVGFEDSDNLRRLQRQVDLLFIPEKSFKPHLTLARVKRHLQDTRPLVAAVNQLQVKPLSFKISSFRLYMSTLTSLGPVYEVLESFKAERHSRA